MSSIYELEIRAIVPEEEKKQIVKKLEEIGEQIDSLVYHTILYRNDKLKPKYIRIRHRKGEWTFFISSKSKTTSKTKIELNTSKKIEELEEVLHELHNEEYKQGSYIRTERTVYSLRKWIKIMISTMNELGTILEIEHESQTNIDEEKEQNFLVEFSKILNNLGLKELKDTQYQEMLDTMYEKTIQDTILNKTKIKEYFLHDHLPL